MRPRFLSTTCLYGWHLGGLEVGHYVELVDQPGRKGEVIGFTQNPRAPGPEGIAVHLRMDDPSVASLSCSPGLVKLAES